MKMYNKSKLTFADGMFVTKKGKIVTPVPIVGNQMDELERMFQQAKVDAKIKTSTAELEKHTKEIEEAKKQRHERKFSHQQTAIDALGITDAKTPIMDKKVEEALGFMKELDTTRANNNMAWLAAHFSQLVLWVTAEEVVMEDSRTGFVMDLPELGDPLRLDRSDLLVIFAFIARNLDADFD